MKKRKQNLKRVLTGFLAAALVASLLPASALAADGDESSTGGSVTVNGVTYTYVTDGTDGYAQIGDTSVYYAVADGETALSGTLYGTASLEYEDYYEGDVTEGYTYDAITTATVGDYSMFTNAYTDFDEETSTDGYNILGVSNVDIAVDAAIYAEAEILEAAGALPEDGVYVEAAAVTLNEDATAVPTSYKTLNSDGSYSAFTYADDAVTTITDATPEFSTGSTWGEYEIDLEEDSTLYLRNSRSDTYTDDDGNTQTYAVGSNITGLILTAEDAEGNETSVGLAYLANIWIQPYKLSWNAYDTTATKNIAYSGATDKYEAISGKTITTITYLTADGKYVYELGDESVYVKPAYTGTVTGSFNEDITTFTLDADTVPEMENAQMTINYCVPGTRGSTDYALYSGDVVTTEIELDTDVIPDSDGYYEIVITSDTYADIEVQYGILASQQSELEALIEQGSAILAVADDATLQAHVTEATELLASDNPTGNEAEDLIDELTELVGEYEYSVYTYDIYYKHAVTTNYNTYLGDSAYVFANEDGTYSVVINVATTVSGLSDVGAEFEDVTVETKSITDGVTTYVLTLDDLTQTIDFTFSYTVAAMGMTMSHPFQLVLDGGTYDDSHVYEASTDEDTGITTYTCKYNCGDTYYEYPFDVYYKCAVTTNYSTYLGTSATVTENEDGTYAVTFVFDGTSAMLSDVGATFEGYDYTESVDDEGYATYVLTLDDLTQTIDFEFHYTITAMSRTNSHNFQIVLAGGTWSGHSLSYVEAVEATATEDGNIAYYVCDTCGEYFADADATESLTEEDIVIEATGETEEETIDVAAGTYTVPVSTSDEVSAMGVDFGIVLADSATAVVNEDGSVTLTLNFLTDASITIAGSSYAVWIGSVTDAEVTTAAISDQTGAEQTAVVTATLTFDSVASAYDVTWYLSSTMMSMDRTVSIAVDWDNAEAVSDDGTDDGSTDDGSTDDGSTDDGSTDDGSTDDGSTDDGSTDDGSTDDGSTDDGSTDDGSTDDGSTDDGSTGDGSTDDGSTGDGSTGDGSTDGDSSTDGGSTDDDASEAVSVDAGTYTVPVSISDEVTAMSVDFGCVLTDSATAVVNEDGTVTLTLTFATDATITMAGTEYAVWVSEFYGVYVDGELVTDCFEVTTTTDESGNTVVETVTLTLASVASSYELSYYLASNMMSYTRDVTLTVDWDNAVAAAAEGETEGDGSTGDDSSTGDDTGSTDGDSSTGDGTGSTDGDSSTGDGSDTSGDTGTGDTSGSTGDTNGSTGSVSNGSTAAQPAAQTIKVKNNKKTIKAKKLKSKKQTFKLKTTVSGNAKVTYKKLKKKTNKALKKGYKALKISKKGKVTVKKGTAKGTYKIKVKVTAKATSDYKAATKTITVTVKVK